MRSGDLAMLVRLGGPQARFNGEFVRLIGPASFPWPLTMWEIEPLFKLPEPYAPVCAEQYLRRIDPDGREVSTWRDGVWLPTELRIREHLKRNPFRENA